MLYANFILAMCAFLMLGTGFRTYAATRGAGPWPLQWGVAGTVRRRATPLLALAIALLVPGAVLGLVASEANRSGRPLVLVLTSLVVAGGVCVYFIAVLRDKTPAVEARRPPERTKRRSRRGPGG